MDKKLFNNKDQDIQQIPTTPRKRSQFKQYENNSQSKIKYRYTIVEKPTHSYFGKIFFIIWILFLIGSFYVSYQAKILNLSNTIKNQLSACQKDYQINKCQTPLKGVKQFCAQKLKCIQANPEQILNIRMQGALFFGLLIRQFFQGLGLPLILVMLVYLIFGGRKSSQVKKQFVQYYP